MVFLMFVLAFVSKGSSKTPPKMFFLLLKKVHARSVLQKKLREKSFREMQRTKDQVQPAIPYPIRPSHWRAATADTAESTDVQGWPVNHCTPHSTAPAVPHELLT
jgi:hypothetical protein